MSFVVIHAVIVLASLAFAFTLGYITGKTVMSKKTIGNN
tara:strand:+ start:6908 stop:7024 length:117 start_codon:yes stop_codon:yes gene_type:complete